MKFNIIVAMDKNRGIGLNNKLPWYFKEDMTYFKNLTKGAGNNAIVMGKNTYQSINKALPFRDNIVLSTSLQDLPDQFLLCKSIKELMNLVDEKNYDEVWIIGGSNIYKQFIYMFEYINKIFITHIDSSYNCDTFFPELPENYTLETSSITSEKYTLLNFQRYINLK